MRKILVFMVVLCSIGIAQAATIDAQSTTICNSGNCQTTVDLSKYFTALEITNVKATDLDVSKPKLDTKLTEFSYRYDKNSLIFEGRVKENTYWTFDLKNGYVIDPYWYYTTETVVTSATDTQSVSRSDYRGIFTYVDNTCNLTAVEKYSSTTATDAYVFFYNESHWANNSFSGANATFSGIELQAGEYYYIVAGNEAGGSYTSRQTSNDKFPYSSYHLTMLNGTWSGGGWGIDRTSYALYRIFCESEEAIYYENMLYLNGNQSNTSMYSDTEFNATAVTNLTGLTALIYINGTLSANDTNSSTNITNLSVGIYNITGWFGNTTANDTITYWLTVNSPLPTASGSTIAFCSDNNTLFTNKTQIINGATNNTQESFYCEYGCDNVTFSCAPPEFIQDIMTYGVIAFILILVVIVHRKVRF